MELSQVGCPPELPLREFDAQFRTNLPHKAVRQVFPVERPGGSPHYEAQDIYKRPMIHGINTLFHELFDRYL